MNGKKGKTDPLTSAEQGEDIRSGTSVAVIKQAILDNLHYVQGRIPELASRNDWYKAAT